MNTYYAYILASSKNGALYIGVTNNLGRRVLEHQNAIEESHTKTYSLLRLVYYEQTEDIRAAIARRESN